MIINLPDSQDVPPLNSSTTAFLKQQQHEEQQQQQQQQHSDDETQSYNLPKVTEEESTGKFMYNTIFTEIYSHSFFGQNFVKLTFALLYRN